MATVLITGAGKGLGKALVREFVENKYDLLLHSKSSIFPPYDGVKCTTLNGDLSDINVIDKLANEAINCDIDILINNAGIYLNAAFIDMSDEDFIGLMRVNLVAPILLTKRIWPLFVKKKSGMIININSLAGKFGSNGEVAYCSSKHGLRGFSSSLQFEATNNGIKIIDVYLGAMETDMTCKKSYKGKLIDVADVSKTIFKLCADYKSLRITEIDINRSIYA